MLLRAWVSSREAEREPSKDGEGRARERYKCCMFLDQKGTRGRRVGSLNEWVGAGDVTSEDFEFRERNKRSENKTRQDFECEM
jgi:hypothetical protein